MKLIIKMLLGTTVIGSLLVLCHMIGFNLIVIEPKSLYIIDHIFITLVGFMISTMSVAIVCVVYFTGNWMYNYCQLFKNKGGE